MFIVDASSPHPTHNLTIISWDQACYWPYSTGVSPGLSVVSGGQGVFVNVFWMIECWGSLFSVPCRTPLILLFPIITTKFRRCICIWAYFPMEINWLNTCFPPKLSAVPYGTSPSGRPCSPSLQWDPVSNLWSLRSSVVMPGSSVLAKLGCVLSCPIIKKTFLLIQGGSYYKLDFPNTQDMSWLKEKKIQRMEKSKQLEIKFYLHRFLLCFGSYSINESYRRSL